MTECIDVVLTFRYIPNMKETQLQLRVSHKEKEKIRMLARKAGMDMSQWVLTRLFADITTIFMDRLAAVASAKDKDRSFALNDLAAFLQNLNRDDLKEVTKEEPALVLDEFLNNYFAAMIEQACAGKEIEPPLWTAKHTGLEKPYFGSTLRSLKLYLLTVSPPPFRCRNIFIDSSVGELV